MTRYTCVRLAPKGPFHFGGRGVGLEHTEAYLPADSLFSALCTVLAQQAGPSAVTDLLAQFTEATRVEELPFRLTSLMSYAANVMLLPYPKVGSSRVPGTDDLRIRKQFKAIQWVSVAVFQHLARYDSLSNALEGARPITIHGGQVWLTNSERNTLMAFSGREAGIGAEVAPILWRNHVRPRVTVDRQTSASALYAVGTTHFNRAVDEKAVAGLYTMIEWLAASDAIRHQVELAFQGLGQVGIGGKRSSGYGQFEPMFDHTDEWMVGSHTGNYFATLSPYHPRRHERAVIGPGSSYEISLHRGWLSLPGYQNLRRASVRMITEGSVLCWPTGLQPFGDLVEVSPAALSKSSGVTIYRYGLAFPVRIADAAVPPAGHDEGLERGSS